MASPRASYRRLAAATIAATILAMPWEAWASAQGQAEVGYNQAETRVVDETGHASRVDTSAWSQRYRLSLSEELMPLLNFSASGALDWTKASVDEGVLRADSDQKTWIGNARLSFGGPILNGGLDYDRRQVDSSVNRGGVTAISPTVVRETYGGGLSWRPSELPSLDLRVSRIDAYDSTRRGLDTTTQDASLSAGFDPVSTVDLRYTLRGSETEDHLRGVRTTNLTNTGLIRWGDKFLDDRIHTYASYGVTSMNSATTVTGAGVVATQRFPLGGLSIVEGPIDTPLHVTLNANGALVDGNTTQSAGVNLGFSASAGPIVTYRDLGAQLPNDVTRVTRIVVYVDRDVQAVAGQLVWTAYWSKDNVDWTPIGPAGAVAYDPLQSRFDIPIQPTEQRYLKIVTKPIVRQLTTDPAFSEIFVTELQLFDDVPANEVRGSSFQLSQSASGSLRARLLREPSLYYDFSGTITRLNSPHLLTWLVVNGLSYSDRLSERLTSAARLERSDSEAGTGHDASTRWSGALSYEPLPTLSGTLSYTGQYGQHPAGDSLSHSIGALARAELYQGIAMSTTSSGSWVRSETGRETRSADVSWDVSLVPNSRISTSGSGSYSRSWQTGGGLPELRDYRGILQVGLSLVPFPSLSLSGNVARIFGSHTASTTYGFNGAFSPFRGGALVFTYAYTETYDTGTRTLAISHGPALRWNIRPRWYLNANYAFQETTTPAQHSSGQALGVNLVITL